MAMTAQLGEIANFKGYAAGPALTAAGGVRSATLGDMNLIATMQGQRVVAQDQLLLSAAMPAMVRLLIPYFGVILAETAKEFHFPNIDTRDTYDSIKADNFQILPGGGSIDVSVSTPQAKFLEFGFVHYKTGQWIHNPFMIPAADLVAPEFVSAVEQVAATAAGLRFFTGAAATSPANDLLGQVRGGLYSYSKFAGDIQVLGFRGLSKSRGFAVHGARNIGNIQAAQAGTLAGRTERLIAGRFGGNLIRGGSLGGTFGSSIFSGPAGRIYNRVSGRAFGGALSNIGVGTGFGF